MKRGGRRITRRGIQIVLGLLWTLDGLLQFQPAMFTRAFAAQVIAPAGQGQPGFVSWPIHEMAHLIGFQPVIADLSFGLIQLALGLGILYPRTARWALAASVVWALSVWYLGEGLGDLLGGGASLLTGAPGAALMYAVVAMAVTPRRAGQAGDQRPARWAAPAWAALWLGGTLLQVLPGADTNASISTALTMNASGAPGWLAAVSHHLSVLVPYHGVSIVVDLVVLQTLAGIGVLMARRTSRLAVLLGISLSLVYWVAGQDIGQFWSGTATDPNTAPLMVLLGLIVLGATPWRQPGMAWVSMTAKAPGGIATVSCVIAIPGLDAASRPTPRCPSGSRTPRSPRLAAMRSLPRRTSSQRASSSKSACTRSSRGSVSSGRARRNAISSRYQARMPRYGSRSRCAQSSFERSKVAGS